MQQFSLSGTVQSVSSLSHQLKLLFSCLYQLRFFTYAHWFHIVLTLLIVSVSYAAMIVKVLHNPPPQPFGSAASDRKLSMTLFIVTVVSILTILLWAIYAVIEPLSIWNNRSKTRELCIGCIVYGLYYASSMENPLIYAIRMQEFRKVICKELTCKKIPESRHVKSNELQAI